MTDTSTAPSRGTAHRHLGWALVLISVAQLMVVLDSTIANIALPYIKADLGISQANLQWVVTGYALAFGGLLLLGGRLGDLYGRRRIFMVGVTIFAVASGLGGFAQNELMLIGSRGLQGLGAAIASPTALALITTTFPAGPPRNRAFSVYAAMSGVGAAVGLILGGWLTGLHPHVLGHLLDGWRLTFLINVPIGLAAAFAAPRLLAESESHPGELDLPGAATGTLGLASIVYGLSRAAEPAHGWGDTGTVAALVVGLVLLGVFIIVERSVEHPLLPFRILANRTRGVAFVTMMFVPAAMFAMFYFLSQVVQDVMGYTPLHTGVAFLPFSFGLVLAATAASRLMNRVDPRFIAGTGTALAGLALLLFSRISVDDSAANLLRVAAHGGQLGSTVGYWTDLLPPILLMSFGMGLTFVPMTLSAVHGVDHRDSGIGSGVLNTMQQVGGALGLATLSTIAVHAMTGRIQDLAAAVKAAVPSGAPTPSAQAVQRVHDVVYQAAFTQGATHAFLTGAFMIWAASVIVWSLLDVKHAEMATDEVPEGVAAA
jgi:EmrB/QacA subfamily drug resistance transporter